MQLKSALQFPDHAVSLHLTHNEHKSYYQSVEQAIADENHGYTDDCWVSDEEKQKAIETNDCWILQWYPDTPVGFHILAAHDLYVLLAKALMVR